ncbi:MAG: hypothetical protein GQ535_16955 [Rhodobacteraceae bacterium]|nr:hypothetical protein [Paracoccaceae bacterium]
MKHLAAALCLFASPALAQITPADVLESWQQFSSRNEAGFAFERQESEGEEITRYNVTLEGVPAALPWVKLTASAGGEVEISTVKNLAWEAPLFGGILDFKSKGTARLQGLSVRASGRPNDVLYAFTLNSFSSNILNDYRESSDHTTRSLRGLSGTLTHRWTADLGDAFAAKLIAGLWEANTDSTIRGENGGREYDSVANVTLELEAALSNLESSTFSYTSGAQTFGMSFGGDFNNETSTSLNSP